LSTLARTFNAGNWQSVRTVTVTGVDDAIINRPNRTAAVFFSNNTFGDRVLVTALDDDQEITVSRTGLRVGEAGGIATYTLVLKDPPVSNVVVTPVSDDPMVATVSGTLTFTIANWEPGRDGGDGVAPGADFYCYQLGCPPDRDGDGGR